MIGNTTLGMRNLIDEYCLQLSPIIMIGNTPTDIIIGFTCWFAANNERSISPAKNILLWRRTLHENCVLAAVEQ